MWISRDLFSRIIEHISCTIEIHAQNNGIWKLSRKVPPPYFCLFMRHLARITCVECPWFPYYKSTLRFLKVGQKSLPHPPFLPFRARPVSNRMCGIPMVPILQIHTQIPPIWISSVGYQLYQLFKILTYREVQDTGSWCRWKPCRQPPPKKISAFSWQTWRGVLCEKKDHLPGMVTLSFMTLTLVIIRNRWNWHSASKKAPFLRP